MKSTFAFLDSSFKIPQHLQMIALNNYATKNDIKISFYGNEPIGFEYRHDLFLEYLNTSREESYLFFTIDQLTLKGNLINKKLILYALNKSINLYFASEQFKISNLSDLNEAQLLLYSKNNELII